MEEILKVIDNALRSQNCYIDSLRADRDKLTAENKQLRERIKELETEIGIQRGNSCEEVTK